MIRNTAVASLLLSLPLVAVSACSSSQQPSSQTSSQTSSTPAVQSSAASATSSAAPAAGTLAAHLKTPDGKLVANATFDFSGGHATVHVETVATGILAPGSHGVHIHEFGKCEPNSLAPNSSGPPGNFLSAGGHYQAPGHTSKPESGDLAPLQVGPDGSGSVQTPTDAFTRDQLLAGNGTALMIHGVGDMAMDRIAC